MIAATLLAPPRLSLLRHSGWDALLSGLALMHGLVVLAMPAAAVIAIGLWWNSNTISHYFIHRPFFRPRALNVLFSFYLTGLLGVPQSLWRERHLAHHAERDWKLRITPRLLAEMALLLSLWGILLVTAPLFFVRAYLPGYVIGLVLCWLHGYYEHVGHGCISHYGALYNLLFFNDGYHVEHHLHPGEHWSRLPDRIIPGADASHYPAILRWLEAFSLESLERLVLRSELLQGWVLRCHEQAFRRLLAELPAIRCAAIVGGGLFPRTFLILHKLLPHAQLMVIDQNAENLGTARRWLPQEVLVINACYEPARTQAADKCGVDLLVIPLSFIGDREAIYRQPPARAVLLHDWIWRRRGPSAVVSLFLLKRLNLVMQPARRHGDTERERGISPHRRVTVSQRKVPNK